MYALSASDVLRNVLTLDVTFRPELPDGLILYSQGSDNLDYFALFLEDGRLVFEFNLGKDDSSFIPLHLPFILLEGLILLSQETSLRSTNFVSILRMKHSQEQMYNIIVSSLLVSSSRRRM